MRAEFPDDPSWASRSGTLKWCFGFGEAFRMSTWARMAWPHQDRRRRFRSCHFRKKLSRHRVPRVDSGALDSFIAITGTASMYQPSIIETASHQKAYSRPWLHVRILHGHMCFHLAL
ncbi:hypothetical protein DENSPDRAFT_836101 [Dentipellis sp. KUC8613]|nr:hypothetical protein DENSPDRAFT_836101 [Dentipellis sp. KUC8613]